MKFEWNNIYLINMDEHTDRLELTKKEFETAGIKNYTRFSGVKYNDGKTTQDRIIGCKLSHINIIKEAKKQNLEYVIILEDDIQFNPQWQTYIPNIKNFVENNEWNLFYFGGSHFKDNANRKLISDRIFQVSTTYTTHAYMCHSNTYDFYLSLEDTMHPIDNILVDNIQKKGKSYCIHPNIIWQRTGISYIQNAHRDYSWIKRT